MSNPRNDPAFPSRAPQTPSIWDHDIDPDKLAKLTSEQRAKFFPNDFTPAGDPYGDF